MPNGVPKQNQFDAATRVMESDLLQVLTEKSSDVDDDSESDRSRGAALQIEVVVEQPVEGNVTTTNEQVAAKNDEKVGPPPLVAAPAASPTMATSPSDVAPERPPRRSRVFIVAGIVAAAGTGPRA
jgi:hypothetical protein